MAHSSALFFSLPFYITVRLLSRFQWCLKISWVGSYFRRKPSLNLFFPRRLLFLNEIDECSNDPSWNQRKYSILNHFCFSCVAFLLHLVWSLSRMITCHIRCIIGNVHLWLILTKLYNYVLILPTFITSTRLRVREGVRLHSRRIANQTLAYGPDVSHVPCPWLEDTRSYSCGSGVFLS